ncbi:PleD family two-component system response regulator [Pedobacter fastidiosus]|uniref:response regulator n=1 Tax=Pedobacter fastidiosus TaxID=2765361 RepID=UPI0036195997
MLEDDQSNLDILKIMLESENYTVEGIYDANKLKDSLKDFQPDLLVMDIDLGNADGRLLCNELKSDANFKQMPIILITGISHSQIAKIECEADAIIGKPFNVKNVILAVDTLLSKLEIE